MYKKISLSLCFGKIKILTSLRSILEIEIDIEILLAVLSNFCSRAWMIS